MHLPSVIQPGFIVTYVLQQIVTRVIVDPIRLVEQQPVALKEVVHLAFIQLGILAARVSTTDQSLEVQERALRAAGCNLICLKKRSRTAPGRTDLRTVLDFLRKCTVLIVTRIDRSARSIEDAQKLTRRMRRS
jgi:hypothetical protein